MSASPLLRLPVELHLNIINHLELHEKVKLASTIRYFRSIIDPPSHQDFVATEMRDWAVKEQFYACKGCTSFRRFGDFADGMKKGKHVRGGPEAHTRFCLRCGVECMFYAPGAHLILSGKPHVLCGICGTLSDEIGSQSACARCSPLRWKANDLHYEPDFALTRSARYRSERIHPGELYEEWYDT